MKWFQLLLVAMLGAVLMGCEKEKEPEDALSDLKSSLENKAEKVKKDVEEKYDDY